MSFGGKAARLQNQGFSSNLKSLSRQNNGMSHARASLNLTLSLIAALLSPVISPIQPTPLISPPTGLNNAPLTAKGFATSPSKSKILKILYPFLSLVLTPITVVNLSTAFSLIIFSIVKNPFSSLALANIAATTTLMSKAKTGLMSGNGSATVDSKIPSSWIYSTIFIKTNGAFTTTFSSLPSNSYRNIASLPKPSNFTINLKLPTKEFWIQNIFQAPQNNNSGIFIKLSIHSILKRQSTSKLLEFIIVLGKVYCQSSIICYGKVLLSRNWPSIKLRAS